MARFKAHIAYKGTNFSGWQRQPNAMTVQEVVESKLSILLNNETSIVGCGRTDAGVHASNYVFHFDAHTDHFDFDLRHRFNRMVGNDILMHSVENIHPDFHARFDAKARTYRYYLTRHKSPFSFETKTYLPQFNKIHVDKLHESAKLILKYNEFFPFCKANSDAETMLCDVSKSEWRIEDDEYIFTIRANRFLRGMVRLLVGMSIRVSIGDTAIDDVIEALENQSRLTRSWSAPPEGLFLEDIEY